jgi:hypothetical protein
LTVSGFWEPGVTFGALKLQSFYFFMLGREMWARAPLFALHMFAVLFIILFPYLLGWFNFQA